MRPIFAHGFFSWGDTGAVDETHEFAQRKRPGNNGLAICFLADIAFHKGSAYFIGDCLPLLDLHVGDQHPPAKPCEQARRTLTQARSPARDHKYFSCNVHGYLRNFS